MRKKILSLSKTDFVFQTFRAGGKGGQKQNKTSSGARIVHTKSGATGECRNHRSQIQNKREAFKRLIASDTFQAWLKIEIARECGALDKAEEEVDRLMHPDNILTEVMNNKGLWEVYED